ncbi:hypothetical protein RHSIM_Rhsim06G0126600 [Rhododendron simsii]|uniref:Uncharacterized protein n=1 Tax=Rhododendron simsii TaxID=118357 RepID=A0A834LNL5_RHOSS|nr:hypothetical protein RHSIM_Rhsim06G0126600 [Rhododendron simsii]
MEKAKSKGKEKSSMQIREKIMHLSLSLSSILHSPKCHFYKLVCYSFVISRIGSSWGQQGEHKGDICYGRLKSSESVKAMEQKYCLHIAALGLYIQIGMGPITFGYPQILEGLRGLPYVSLNLSQIFISTTCGVCLMSYHRTSPFCCNVMMVGQVSDEFEWSKRAIHVNRLWYAKRFLHPRIVATNDYVFIRDDDLGVEHFDPEEYIKLMTNKRDDSEVYTEIEEIRCTDPHLPPCVAYVFNLLKSWHLCFLETHGAVFDI